MAIVFIGEEPRRIGNMDTNKNVIREGYEDESVNEYVKYITDNGKSNFEIGNSRKFLNTQMTIPSFEKPLATRAEHARYLFSKGGYFVDWSRRFLWTSLEERTFFLFADVTTAFIRYLAWLEKSHKKTDN